VNASPVRDVSHRREDNSRVRELRPEEKRRLLAVIRARFPHHEPEFQFARHTGLRQGSQYGLTWEMVDWESSVLHIPRTKNEEPLHVPLNKDALAILRKLQAHGNGKDQVFCSRETGKPLGGPKHWFTAAVREAGIEDFHWHDLRHDFATRLRRAGVPLEDIADLLGHKTLAMTKRYAHISMDRLRDAVSRLAEEPTGTRTDTKLVEQSEGGVAYVN
jgi:integrase